MIKYLIMTLLTITSLGFSKEEQMELLISSEEIDQKIVTISQRINEDYADKHLTILMVMKGAVCITSDLIRNLDVPFKLEYLKASSYGENGMVGGSLTLAGLDSLDIEGRDVLVIDDIYETGNTICQVMEMLKTKKPNSIKSFVLLLKDVPRKNTYRPDYVLFDIPNRFVIGYGLDYKEFYRGLPGIYAFIGDKAPF
jgi:hypoxanthine phosphoribosyltransferase